MREVPRALRFLRWALPDQWEHQGRAPDTPEGRTYANYVCVRQDMPSMMSCRASATMAESYFVHPVSTTVDKRQKLFDSRPASSSRQLKHGSPCLDLENISPFVREIRPSSSALSSSSAASSSSSFSTRLNLAFKPFDQDNCRLPLKALANSANSAAACLSFLSARTARRRSKGVSPCFALLDVPLGHFILKAPLGNVIVGKLPSRRSRPC